MRAKPARDSRALLLAALLAGACGTKEKADPPGKGLDAGVLESPAATALSNQAVSALARAVLAETLEVPARIQADERSDVQVTVPVDGRLEDVRVRTSEQAVAAGEILAFLVSPELAAAQREDLLVDPASDPGLARKSEERLRRMGLSAGQVAGMRRTRRPVDRLPIRSPAAGYVLAAREPDQAMPPGPGMQGTGDPGNMGGTGGGMGGMGGPGGMGGGMEAGGSGSVATGGTPGPRAAEGGIRAGSYVVRGQVLARINPLVAVAAVLSLPAAQAGHFRVGDSVRLDLPTVPFLGRARIDFLEARVADTGGHVQARIHLDNRDRRFQPGLLGKARLAARPETAWVLPRAAVHDLGGRHVVWARSPQDTGVFEAREIRVGRGTSRLVEVLEGLAPGESVAANASLLADPDAVLEPRPLPGPGAQGSPGPDHPAGHGSDTAGPPVPEAEPGNAGHAGHGGDPDPAGEEGHDGHAAQDAPGSHAGPASPGLPAPTLHVPDAQAARAGIRVQAAAAAHLVPTQVFRAVTRFDEGAQVVVPARAEGRLAEVAVLRPGEQVARGQTLATLRSETLLSAQEEFLSARRMASGPAPAAAGRSQAQAARRRLLTLGLDEAQVAALERSGKPAPALPVRSPRDGILLEVRAQPGQYVTEGLPLFVIGRSDRIWVETWLLASEAAAYPEGSAAAVRIEGIPGEPLAGRLAHVRREASQSGSAVPAHVSVPNPLGRILPGLQAWVTLAHPARHAQVAVPPGALLRSSRHTMAWVRVGRETYAPRRVETGLETPEAVEVLSGIRAGEAVVVGGAYLLDSEWSYRQGGAKAHAGH